MTEHSVRASEKRVRRVMAEEGLAARSTARSPHRYSSYRGEGGRAVAPNLLLREGSRDSHDFSAASPGLRVATDVTEFRLGARGPRCYLSAAVDLHDGRMYWGCGRFSNPKRPTPQTPMTFGTDWDSGLPMTP